MSYIVTVDDYFVARNYMGNYMASDQLLPLMGRYGGGCGASGALCYDTLPEAQRYIEHNRDMYDGVWHVREYNTCCNTVGGIVL